VDPRSYVESARAAAGRTGEALKPRLRGWLHLVTSPVALAAGIVLAVLAPTGPAAAAAAAYGLTAVVLFTTSALYHRGSWSPRMQAVLRRVDHASIFVLIAGSYTPFAVLALSGATRIAVLAAVWSGALVGAVFRIFWVAAPRRVIVPVYLGLGWTAAFVLPQLLHGAGVAAFVLIAVGGLLYTLGALSYALRRPNPWPRWFGFHEVFHACTIAGYVCQYVAASLLVYRLG
jgi:hemolysin III